MRELEAESCTPARRRPASRRSCRRTCVLASLVAVRSAMLLAPARAAACRGCRTKRAGLYQRGAHRWHRRARPRARDRRHTRRHDRSRRSCGPGEDPSGAAVTDLHGKVLMPGLADMHVHLLGGWDGHAVDMLGYRRYMNALLYAGVTTVLDTGNVQPYIVQLRAETAAGRLLGPHIYCVGGIVDGADPVWPPISYAVGSVGQVAPVVKGLKRDNVDLIKGYVGLSHSVLERLVEEGRKVSLKVIVDQWQRNGSTDLVEDGIYGFAHLPTRPVVAGHRALHAGAQHGLHLDAHRVRKPDPQAAAAISAFLDDPLVRDTSPPSFLEGLRAEAPASSMREEAERKPGGGRSCSRTRWPTPRRCSAPACCWLPEPMRRTRATCRAKACIMSSSCWWQRGLRRSRRSRWRPATPPGSSAPTTGARSRPAKLATLIVVDGRPDRNISDTRKVVEVMLRGRKIDRESLKLVHQNDPGYEPVSPTDF